MHLKIALNWSSLVNVLGYFPPSHQKALDLVKSLQFFTRLHSISILFLIPPGRNLSLTEESCRTIPHSAPDNHSKCSSVIKTFPRTDAVSFKALTPRRFLSFCVCVVTHDASASLNFFLNCLLNLQ